jgi:hypothetical protein
MTSIALVLSALVAASPADTGLSAADLQRAKDLFGAGQKLYKAASYSEAITKFQEAYAVRPHPVILFNIAKCYEQLADDGKAMRAYRDYLRFSPDAKDKEAVVDAIANLERHLKERGQNQVIVFTDPASARVEIDGKDVGLAPASAELTAGAHKIVVRSRGYETVDRSYTMSISRASEMTINLKPSTPALPTAETAGDAPKKDELKVVTLSPAQNEPVAAASPVVANPVTVTTKAPGAKKGRVWSYVAGGVAVAALGGGIALGVLSNNASSELRATEHSRADATALATTATSFSTGANITYGVAAGVAITAVILFFVEK